MNRLLRRAIRDETGAVTADWVVLTALVVGLAGGLMTILQDPIDNGGAVIANKIAASN
jgi:Flp pilus assembly pilin Flp